MPIAQDLSLQNRLGQIHPLYIFFVPFGAYQPGSIQVGAPQIRPGEICPVQVGLLEICLSQIRPLELRLLKVPPKKDRLLEVGLRKSGLAEVRPKEVGLLKIGLLETGLLKIGLLEYRLLKIRLSKVCASEVRPFETRPLKLRPLQVRPLKVSLLEVCPTEIGILEVGLLKVQLLELRTAQIRMYLGILFPPPIPGLNALIEYVEVVLICHLFHRLQRPQALPNTLQSYRSLPETFSRRDIGWVGLGLRGQSSDHDQKPADSSSRGGTGVEEEHGSVSNSPAISRA